MPRLLYNWFVLAPAGLIDYVVLSALGFAALVPPIYAWHWTIRLMEPDKAPPFPAKPTRFVTWIVAMVVGAYVFLVCGVALVQLPHAYFLIVGRD